MKFVVGKPLDSGVQTRVSWFLTSRCYLGKSARYS